MPSALEGFGVAAAEAIAVGVLPILSRRPALTEFAELGAGIEWVDCDVPSIREAIRKLSIGEQATLWDLGQDLAKCVPGYCGLSVGPKQLSVRYRALRT